MVVNLPSVSPMFSQLLLSPRSLLSGGAPLLPLLSAVGERRAGDLLQEQSRCLRLRWAQKRIWSKSLSVSDNAFAVLDF